MALMYSLGHVEKRSDTSYKLLISAAAFNFTEECWKALNRALQTATYILNPKSINVTVHVPFHPVETFCLEILAIF